MERKTKEELLNLCDKNIDDLTVLYSELSGFYNDTKDSLLKMGANDYRNRYLSNEKTKLLTEIISSQVKIKEKIHQQSTDMIKMIDKENSKDSELNIDAKQLSNMIKKIEEL